MSELTAYEQQRLANIAANHAHLVALGLADEESKLIPKPAPATASTTKKRSRTPSGSVEPRRKSGRLASTSAPLVFVADERPGGQVTLGGVDAAATVAAAQSDKVVTKWSRKNRSASELWETALHAMQAVKDEDENEPLSVRRERIAAAAEARAAASAAPRATASAADDSYSYDELVSLVGMPDSMDDLFTHERPAFEALLAWKRARAKELGYNDPCIICHNRTLCELVRLVPSDTKSLLRVFGIGPKRVVQHGQLMLDALSPFRAALLAKRPRRQVATAPPPPAPVDAATPKAAALRSSGGRASGWNEADGAALASPHWRALDLPAGPWSERRQRCANVDGCAACARFVADGRPFDYAVQSQKVLDALASPGAYGSHAAAHAAGWRWHAAPNHNSNSHNHKWWPPQAVVERMDEDGMGMGTVKMPLGSNAVLALLARHEKVVFGDAGEEEEAELAD